MRRWVSLEARLWWGSCAAPDKPERAVSSLGGQPGEGKQLLKGEFGPD